MFLKQGGAKENASHLMRTDNSSRLRCFLLKPIHWGYKQFNKLPPVQPYP